MKEERLGPGISVQGFETFEEMQAYLADQETRAVEESLDEQWRITWGSRVLRHADDLVIFGHIFTEREFLAENSEPVPHEEILFELDGLKEAHTRGYRYGKWYSIVEPDGEYGSAHVVSLWEITTSDFEVARRNEWKIWPALAERVQREVTEATTRKGTDDDQGTNR